ncbi:hypothetical protein ETB97_011391 [Aspergillus alliaceus]|uniref:Uncharacterized protein n=1 Tax=Petromyces alliaceus TaxID=209559 RepID=A0A8H6EBI4_PETAA|nr:hypothetical protein ETB97_011391 [Aspergillus burnettii]
MSHKPIVRDRHLEGMTEIAAKICDVCLQDSKVVLSLSSSLCPIPVDLLRDGFQALGGGVSSPDKSRGARRKTIEGKILISGPENSSFSDEVAVVVLDGVFLLFEIQEELALLTELDG